MYVFILIAGIVIGLVIAGAYVPYKRRKDLQAWAEAHGLHFDAQRRSDLNVLTLFPCLQRGNNRYAHNIIQGTWHDREMLAFDYHYQTESHGSKGQRQTQDHLFSAVIVRSPILLKPLQIRPEGMLDKVAGFFGAEDINFESAEFSRKFYVRSPDKKWAYDMLHPRAMEFLLAHQGFRIEFAPTHAIVYGTTLLRCEKIAEAADIICGLFDLLPEYVIQQQGRLNPPENPPTMPGA